MIYITHDLGTVGFICDRLLVLREGRSVETVLASTSSKRPAPIIRAPS